MKDRIGLGLSSISMSEYRPTRRERIKKIGLLAVVAVLLAVFFYYLAAQVQLDTAHATNPDADWKSESR
jgi:hypothetical protein